MRSVADLFWWVLLLGVMVWAFRIYAAPVPERPIRACEPVAWGAKVVRNLVSALGPGGNAQHAGESVRSATVGWCLKYSANLFIDLPRRDEQRQAEQR